MNNLGEFDVSPYKVIGAALAWLRGVFKDGCRVTWLVIKRLWYEIISVLIFPDWFNHILEFALHSIIFTENLLVIFWQDICFIYFIPDCELTGQVKYSKQRMGQPKMILEGERGGRIKGSKGDWWSTNGSVAACCEDPIKNNKGSSRQSVHTPLHSSMMYLSDDPALPNEGTSDGSLTGQGLRQRIFGGGILAFGVFAYCRHPSLLLSDVILCHPQESVFPFLLQMLIKCSG